MQTQDGYSYNVTFVIKAINPAPIDTVDSPPGKATSDIYSPDTQIFVENTTPGRNASSVEVTVGGLYEASRPACEIFRADSRLGHEITVEGKKYCVLLFSQTTADPVQKMSPTERQEFDGNDINGEKQDFNEGRVPAIIADTVKGADRYFVTGIPNSSGPACKIHYSFDFTGGFGGDAIAISPAYKPFSCTPAT